MREEGIEKEREREMKIIIEHMYSHGSSNHKEPSYERNLNYTLYRQVHIVQY